MVNVATPQEANLDGTLKGHWLTHHATESRKKTIIAFSELSLGLSGSLRLIPPEQNTL